MTGILFVVAIGLCAAVLLGRLVAKSLRGRAWQRLPGHAPQNPMVVTRFAEMDAYVATARCPCSGRLSLVSEGGLSTPEHRVRVLHAECLRCERACDFFFDTDQIAH